LGAPSDTDVEKLRQDNEDLKRQHDDLQKKIESLESEVTHPGDSCCSSQRPVQSWLDPLYNPLIYAIKFNSNMNAAQPSRSPVHWLYCTFLIDREQLGSFLCCGNDWRQQRRRPEEFEVQTALRKQESLSTATIAVRVSLKASKSW